MFTCDTILSNVSMLYLSNRNCTNMTYYFFKFKLLYYCIQYNIEVYNTSYIINCYRLNFVSIKYSVENNYAVMTYSYLYRYQNTIMRYVPDKIYFP